MQPRPKLDLPLWTQLESSTPGACLLPGLTSKALRSPASSSDPLLEQKEKRTFSEGGPQAWGLREEKNAALEPHGR